MLIDLTCPAEVFRTLMPTEDIPAVTLTLYNLSDRVIASAEVTIRMLSAAGAEKERMTFRGRALNGRPHSTFTMNVPMAPATGVKSADVIIDKVWFADKDVWRRSEENLTEYTPNNLPVSNALTRLKFAAGDIAVGYPAQQDGLWVCVCGRPNPDVYSVCARCRKEKALVFSLYNRDAVENQLAMREQQLELATRTAREDTARLQRIREEEYNTKKARRGRRIRLAAYLALCLSLVGLLIGVFLPFVRMTMADSALREGNYSEALRLLNEYPGYPGAAEKIRECTYQITARRVEESTVLDELSDAAAALREDAEREGSAALADQADLKRAQLLLADGDIEGARAAVSALPEDSEGRLALEAGCRYLEACNLLDERQYDAAREIFLSLGSYPNADTMAKECVCRQAYDAMNAGDYGTAIALYEKILGYENATQNLQNCHYKIAESLEDAGDYAGAAEEYILADGWRNSAVKKAEMYYNMAEDALERGDYAEARRLYNSSDQYEDSVIHDLYCAYMLGTAAYGRGDFAEAYGLFAELPKNYVPDDAEGTPEEAAERVAELRLECAYRAGCLARAQGDLNTATDYLTKAGSYADAKDQLAEIAAELEEAARAAKATPTPAPVPEGSSDYLVEDDDD